MPNKFSYTGEHALYIISKNAALELIEYYHQEFGLKRFVFRVPTIYCCTPYRHLYQNKIKKKHPIYQMIDKAIAGDTLEIWGNPNYAKDMVYVKDFSQMLCKAIEANRNGGFYNVGTGIPVTLEKQIRTIVEVFATEGRKSEIVYCPEKPGGGGFLIDIGNAKAELGYEPVYSCKKLFEDFKKEMELYRFNELGSIES